MVLREENHRLPSLRSEVESLFGDVLGVGRSRGDRPPHRLPSLDLFEEPTRCVIEMDAPGVRREDLVITVTGRRLTLQGRREIVRELSGSRVRLRERWSGEFSRSLELPGPVDQRRVTATLREGILRIELPWRERRP